MKSGLNKKLKIQQLIGLLILSFLFIPLKGQSCANCYDNCLLEPGEVLISCGTFSDGIVTGTLQQDLGEPVLAIYDTRDPANNGGVLGGNWPSLSGNGFSAGQWTAQDMGEVFGLALRPNFATGCMDYYVAQWGPVPKELFEEGFAYQGDIATACNGGAIFKVDGVTGAVSEFACLPSTYASMSALVIDTDGSSGGGVQVGIYDTYSGLGQITYNKACDVFHVSNFEDGLIYTLDASGNVLGTYDFGMDGIPVLIANNGSAGYLDQHLNGSNQIPDDPNQAVTPWQRRVFGVGYNKHDNHLYFGTINSRENSHVTWGVNQNVYAVEIDPNTCLPIVSTTDHQFEITTGNRSPVSDIHFDVNNNLLLSQMGIFSTLHNKDSHWAEIMHWNGGLDNWSLTTTFLPSTYVNGGGASGGVDFGYNNYGPNTDNADGNCPEESIVYTADAIYGINSPNAVYGIGILPFGGGDVVTDAYNIDGDDDLTTTNKYIFGDIEVIAPSCNLTTLNLNCSADGTNFTISPNCVQDILCDYTVSTSQGTLSATSGNPCTVETFSLSGNLDCSQPINITVTINSCDGSKMCTLTEELLLCCPCTDPVAPIISVTNNTCPSTTDGSFNIDTDCPVGSTIEYSTDGGNTWSSSMPNWADGVSVVTRCVDDIDATCFSPNSNEVTGTLEICTFPSVRLGKTVDAATASLGQTVTFTLTVYNDGTEDLTNVEVTDALPTGLTYTGDNSGGSYDSGTGLWTIPNIAIGDSAVIDIMATIDVEGVVVNEAMITAADQLGEDPDLTDNTDQACVSVPLEVCDNETISVLIEAETGYTNYQWYKDGVLIAGASTDTYTATETGAYTYTVDGIGPTGDCEGELCCPVVIEQVSCCPPIQCIPITVTKLEE